MMKRFARWSLIAVLVIDVAVVTAFLAGGSPLRAAGQATTADETADAAPVLDVETLRALGDELQARLAALDAREATLEELLRAETVLARAGLLEEPAEVDPAEERAQADAEARAASAAQRAAAFTSLSKAYANMEPDSAARALSQLAIRDKHAVIELLLGWQPRTSGAILDALTQVDAALAADLSYAIWSMGTGEAG